MRIIKHYHIDNILQRSVVRHNGLQYLRIARWMYASGVLMEPENSGPTPTWRAQLESEQSATSVTPEEAQELERCFVARLVRQCEENGSIPPKYRLLNLGETIQSGDEFSLDGKVWNPSKAVGEQIYPPDVGQYRRAVLSRSPEAAE